VVGPEVRREDRVGVAIGGQRALEIAARRRRQRDRQGPAPGEAPFGGRGLRHQRRDLAQPRLGARDLPERHRVADAQERRVDLRHRVAGAGGDRAEHLGGRQPGLVIGAEPLADRQRPPGAHLQVEHPQRAAARGGGRQIAARLGELAGVRAHVGLHRERLGAERREPEPLAAREHGRQRGRGGGVVPGGDLGVDRGQRAFDLAHQRRQRRRRLRSRGQRVGGGAVGDRRQLARRLGGGRRPRRGVGVRDQLEDQRARAVAAAIEARQAARRGGRALARTEGAGVLASVAAAAGPRRAVRVERATAIVASAAAATVAGGQARAQIPRAAPGRRGPGAVEVGGRRLAAGTRGPAPRRASRSRSWSRPTASRQRCDDPSADMPAARPRRELARSASMSSIDAWRSAGEREPRRTRAAAPPLGTGSSGGARPPRRPRPARRRSRSPSTRVGPQRLVQRRAEC
jgi:hypothetical protein